jgi:hypothetical protein
MSAKAMALSKHPSVMPVNPPADISTATRVTPPLLVRPTRKQRATPVGCHRAHNSARVQARTNMHRTEVMQRAGVVQGSGNSSSISYSNNAGSRSAGSTVVSGIVVGQRRVRVR